MSQVGYTTAQLLAMRSESIEQTHSSLSKVNQLKTSHDLPPARLSQYLVTEYLSFHRAVTASNVLTFANYCSHPLVPDIVTLDPNKPNTQDIAWAPINRTHGVLRPASRAAQWIRYSRNVASFNLYPATSRDLEINYLLWRIAQDGEYDPTTGNLLLGQNIISLAFPRELFSLLSSVNEKFLEYCMYEVLALIAEDEDSEGLALMESELEPTTWIAVQEYMTNNREHIVKNHTSENENGEMRSITDAVEVLLRLCYLSPWRIDVFAAYISPGDMYNVLVDAESISHSTNGRSPYDLPNVVQDRQLVRSSARRPVSSGNQSYSQMHHYHVHSQQQIDQRIPAKVPIPPGPRSRVTNRNMVFWKLFQDWRRYRKVLVECLDMRPIDANSIMMKSISQGSHIDAWERAEAVMACCMKHGNLFFKLPRETVFYLIAPYILAQG